MDNSQKKVTGGPSVPVALACVLLLALAFAPSARAGLVFSFDIGSPGSGAGQLSGPKSTAVDQATGDVYVADTGNARVEKFDRSGAFVWAIGAGVDAGDNGDICTAISGHTCQAGTPDSAPGHFSRPTAVAVDPTNGDLYVADANTNLVQKFDPSGALITSWGGTPSGGQLNGSTSPDGPFLRIDGIAVDPAPAHSGQLFVYASPGDLMFKFAQDGSFISDVYIPYNPPFFSGVAVDSAGNIYKLVSWEQPPTDWVMKQDPSGEILIRYFDPPFSGATAVALDPSNDHLYVDHGDSVVERDTAGNQLDAFGSGDLTTGAGLSVRGLNHHVYVADSTADHVAVFTPPPVLPVNGLPGVATDSVSGFQGLAATLNGRVNPGGVTVTDCHFDLVPDSQFQADAYAGVTPAERLPCVPDPGSVSREVEVSAAASSLTGLLYGTTYHYRTVATNSFGTNAGSDQTFTTLPAGPLIEPGSESATAIQPASATLNAAVIPEGNATTYHFEYVAEEDFQNGGFSSPATQSTPQSASIGSGFGDRAAAADLTNLAPNTTYHYRVVATNSAHTNAGSGQTFTTLPPVSIDSSSAAAATSTSVTLNAQLNPNGAAATYHFEYGTTTAYGAATPESGPIGADHSDHPVSADLSGLLPGTAYHFRTVATNSFGTAYGPDAIAATNPAANPARGLPDGRAYEQVTPPEKSGANDLFHCPGGDPLYSECLGAVESVYAAPSGDRLLLESPSSFGPNPPLPGDYVFARGSAGWRADGLAPPRSLGAIFEPDIFSADLSHLGERAFALPSSPPGPTSLVSASPGGPFNGLATVPAGYDSAIKGASSDFSHVVFTSTDLNLAPGASGQISGSRALYEWHDGQISVVNVNTDHSLTSTCGAAMGAVTNTYAYYPFTFLHDVSSDGSKVFFVSPDPDTSVSSTGHPSCAQPPHLYMRLDGSTTVDISAPDPGVVDPNGFQRVDFAGASADGSKVFFITRTELTAGDTTHDPAMYEYNTDTHTLTLVAANVARIQGLPVVSEDGAAVYFAVGGGGYTEFDLYRYDTATATTRLVTHTSTMGLDYSQYSPYTTPNGRFLLFPAAGAAVTGYDSGGYQEIYLYDSADSSVRCVSCPPDGSAATSSAEIPSTEIRTVVLAQDGRSARPMSDDGSRVFFDTGQALVPQDNNGQRDVYEWHGGKVSLISSGSDGAQSLFLDSGASGRDVFFSTGERLVPSDTDLATDIYDARTGGGFPEPPSTGAPCEGEGCREVGTSAPAVVGAGTAAFQGPGNPTPKHHKARKHHKKRHHKRHHKRAHHRGHRSRLRG